MVELYAASLVAISIAVSAIVSSRLRISSAIFEVLAGVILGNLLGVKLESWLDFLGTYGGLVLTFLAGAEVEFHILRKKAKPSLVIGTLAFIAPLVAEFLFLSVVTNWTLQAKITNTKIIPNNANTYIA